MLARIAGLGQLYRRTFGEPALAEQISLHHRSNDIASWELQVTDAELFSDRAHLVALVKRWRDRFPALCKWRLVGAQHSWGESYLTFSNVSPPAEELGAQLAEHDGRFYETGDGGSSNVEQANIAIQDILTATGESSLISPLHGAYLSEYALHYIGMFLLSSLVRYRPQTWVHAVTRTATSENPSDDQALALIESFIALHVTKFSALVLEMLGVNRK